VCMYVCMSTDMYNVHVWAQACMHVCVYVCVCVCVCVEYHRGIGARSSG